MRHRYTKIDFELIARVIRNGNNYLNEMVRFHVASDFADMLATTNPRFDRAKFLAACEV